MLSARAIAFLSTLERRPFVATRKVEEIIGNQGFPCYPAWLDFHERYAGYVETIGRDVAVWGLVHENPTWLLPMKADIDRESAQETWYITCADVHPSYNYRLDDKGEFLGNPAESFDEHVERMAVGWEFRREGNTQVIARDELRSQAFLSLFVNMVKSALVPEASDQYFTYYMDDHYLVVEDARTGKLRNAWRHVKKSEQARDAVTPGTTVA
jgi:hypothetical protein